MRIGLLSNFWYLRGGLERVMFADAAGLTARGHEVAPFAAGHHLNEPSLYSQHFPPVVDHSALGRGMSLPERAGTALRLFRNGPALAGFDRYLDEFHPDVIHQHGTSRQLSASVLSHARSRGIPTVLTLHDYSLRCPAGTLSRTDEPECLRVSCAGHRYDRAIRFRCVHGSAAASAVAAMELLVARALRRYERAVDTFLVPSEYVAQRMVESGIPRDRLRVLPNAVEEPRDASASIGSFILAFGRLVSYKGFSTVIEVARALPSGEFVIAGDGPEREALERRATGLRNIRFTGHLGPEPLTELIRRSRAVIVPSLSPESFGMVVLESWREGRPVVATRLGALADIVDDGRTGLLVEPGDPDSTARAVSALLADEDLARTIGNSGREEAQATYSMNAHLDRLEHTYQRLIS